MLFLKEDSMSENYYSTPEPSSPPSAAGIRIVFARTKEKPTLTVTSDPLALGARLESD
jgi:hypothetical protein